MSEKKIPYIYTSTHRKFIDHHFHNYRYNKSALSFLQKNSHAPSNIYSALKYDLRSGLQFLRRRMKCKAPKYYYNEICNLYVFHDRFDEMLERTKTWKDNWEVKRMIVLVELIKVVNLLKNKNVDKTTQVTNELPEQCEVEEHDLRYVKDRLVEDDVKEIDVFKVKTDEVKLGKTINIKEMVENIISYKDLINIVKQRTIAPDPSNPAPIKKVKKKRTKLAIAQDERRSCIDRCKKKEMLTINDDVTFYSFLHDEYEISLQEIEEIETKIRSSNEITNLDLSVNNKLFFYFEHKIIELLKERWDFNLFKTYIDIFNKTCAEAHTFNPMCRKYLKRRMVFLHTESYLKKLTFQELAFIRQTLKSDRYLSWVINNRTENGRILMNYFLKYRDLNALIKFSELHYFPPIYEKLKLARRNSKIATRIRELAIDSKVKINLMGTNEGITIIRYTPNRRKKRVRQLRKIINNIIRDKDSFDCLIAK